MKVRIMDEMQRQVKERDRMNESTEQESGGRGKGLRNYQKAGNNRGGRLGMKGGGESGE